MLNFLSIIQSTDTVTMRGLDWTFVNKVRKIILGHFWPLLNRQSYFVAARVGSYGSIKNWFDPDTKQNTNCMNDTRVILSVTKAIVWPRPDLKPFEPIDFSLLFFRTNWTREREQLVSYNLVKKMKPYSRQAFDAHETFRITKTKLIHSICYSFKQTFHY